MSFFRFFKSDAPQPQGSAAFQAFFRSYLSETFDEERLRGGPEPGVIDRLAPPERAEAERLLLERLARADDGRAAEALALMRSAAAVEPLRRAMHAQAARGPHASPACARALWTLARDPAAIDAVIAIARDPAVVESQRIDAVVALRTMPSPVAVLALQEFVRTAPAYLMRFHGFKGLLLLHGYTAREADDLAGPVAPQIAGAHVRPAARDAMLARLDELLAGRAPIAAG